jgi:dimethylamine/trimethylamine dehydrogenase
VYLALKQGSSGLKSVRAIGDCYAPSTIAAAVYSGHEYARNLDEPPPAEVPFRRQLMGRIAGAG